MTPVDNALDLLAAVMRSAGVSRAELARRLGVSRSVVTDTFRRHEGITLEKLARMFDACGVELVLSIRAKL